ncbi:cell adhesion molecule Dscam1 isoform X2 [Lepeophtheirus salmonis]|uniref:cell adhesion molecule Dscam1 isoform X2 n=1 Tax=Lepeophtheirus salmonis TaxID=72036 RepID=UPI003AF36417
MMGLEESFFLLALLAINAATSHEEDNVPVTSVQSVAGMLTNLPCNITPTIPNDKVNLVLWYKDGFGKPLFSFDLRDETPDSDGKIWANADDGNQDSYRAQLHTRSAPTAVLSLLGVTDEDAGTYRCRVDFKHSPTRYWKVNLSVIVPPISSLILDEKGVVVQGQIGPFNELSTLVLTCDVFGGWPTSKVTWWRNGELLDDTYEEIAPGKSRNTMKVEFLKREDISAEFTCLGNNNNATQPVTTTVSLTLNLRPLDVKLLWDVDPMSSNSEYELNCKTIGAQPSAHISWWLNGDISLKSFDNKVSDDGNVTLSTLKFKPSMQDHGRILSCRAENTLLSDSSITDERELIVYYSPEVELSLGSSLNPNEIKEGDDVYFECKVKAFPRATKIDWQKDGVTLLADAKKGIIINQHSLVIQRVDRKSRGEYVCMATNDEGIGGSNPVELDVHYIPVCSRQGQGIGIGRNEEARVVCHVDGNPDPHSFHWQFNSTSSDAEDLPKESIIIDGSLSVATYVPRGEMDYGTLMCWGKNALGRQVNPCVFHIIPAGKPDGVEGCAVTNKTFTTIRVECKQGYDGGLRQTFVLELYPQNAFEGSLSPAALAGLTPMTKIENRHFPQFSLEKLPQGTGFSLLVYARNSKGESEKSILRAYTLKNAERRVDKLYPEAENTRLSSSDWRHPRRHAPLLWIIVGIASVLLLASMVLGLIIRMTRCCGQGQRRGLHHIHSLRSNSTTNEDDDSKKTLMIRRDNLNRNNRGGIKIKGILTNHGASSQIQEKNRVSSSHQINASSGILPLTESDSNPSYSSSNVRIMERKGSLNRKYSHHTQLRERFIEGESSQMPYDSRRYTTLPRNFHQGSIIPDTNRHPRPSEEIQYAELNLTKNNPSTFCNTLPSSLSSRPSRTIYATINHGHVATTLPLKEEEERTETPPVPAQFADPIPEEVMEIPQDARQEPEVSIPHSKEVDGTMNLTRF